MNISISKIISIASVLGCIGVFVPNQALGVINCYLYKQDEVACKKNPRCEWKVVPGGRCKGPDVCTGIIKYNEEACGYKKEQGCQWVTFGGFCRDPDRNKNLKKS